MIDARVLACVREIGTRENNPVVWLLLGIACGRVDRALPTAVVSLQLLEKVVSCAAGSNAIEDAIVVVDEWIEVHDQMRRTRLRGRVAGGRR